jgi:FkbM family methyltransferase
VPSEKFVIQDVTLEIQSGMLNPKLREVLAGGLYLAEEVRALRRLLRPDDTYFEIGGGVGLLSTLAHRVVRDKARVHVYEADPRQIKTIKRTWKANEVEGNVYECLLGTGPGEYPFHVAKAFWASSRVISYDRGTTVQVEQRDFLQQLDKKAATFLVVEVHGAERDLLDKVLSPKVRAIVARLHPRVAGEVALEAAVRCIAEQGFRPAFEEGTVRGWVR